MATGDDTQKPPTYQHCNTLTDSAYSRLARATKRIKFLLDLLGNQPDRPFTCHASDLEAELESLLNDLEGIQNLFQQQQPDVSVAD